MSISKMKTRLLQSIIMLCALLLSATGTLAQEAKAEAIAEIPSQQQVRQMAVESSVVISVCLESGNITVTGGDRREVRINADDAALVILRRTINPEATTPAARLETLVSDSPEDAPLRSGNCIGSTDLELEVPRGATVYVKTHHGDIDISDVTEVRAETDSGNISARRIAKAVEATSVAGDIFLEDANGRIRLRSISGNIDALNAKAVATGDGLYAKTMSGDVRLEHVAQLRVEAGTITGEVSFTGALMRGGFYDLKTTTGDITLKLPASVSFNVTARVAEGGEVITDFPLKYTGTTNPLDILASGKLVGSYGAAGAAATLNLHSFSGTLRLRKL